MHTKVKRMTTLRERAKKTATGKILIHKRRRIHNSSASISKGYKKRFFRSKEVTLCNALKGKFSLLSLK